MLDLHKTKEYWHEQVTKGDNPCHYHDKWQDAYAFKVRTGAFRKKDFKDVKKVVDIGCGIGEYTAHIATLTDASFVGFDFPFNIEIAKELHKDNAQLSFVAKSLPDKEVAGAISSADVVITTTVYVHLAPEARNDFLKAVESMKPGKRVMMLEYAPDSVPPFQKDLPHKEVETPAVIISKFSAHGFRLAEVRHVNFIDSFFFHHVGKNFLSYYLTICLEFFLRMFRNSGSKYKLLIFEKVS